MLSHFLPSELDVTIVYSLSEWNVSAIHVWVYLQQRNHFSACDLFSENSLNQFRCSVEQSYSNLIMLFFPCLLPLFSTFPCENWAGVGFRGGERETITSVPSYFCHSGHSLSVSYLIFTCFFHSSLVDLFFKMTKTNKSIRSQCPKRQASEYCFS